MIIIDVEVEYIEELAGEALRRLPLDEDDIYSKERLEDLEEDDEISSEEGGFMRGYLGD